MGIKTGGLLVDGVTMGGAVTPTSTHATLHVLDIERHDCALQVTDRWDGAAPALTTHVGNLYYDLSNTGLDADWVSVASGGVAIVDAVAAGVAVLILRNFQVDARYIRVRYEFTGGGGSLYVVANRKPRS